MRSLLSYDACQVQRARGQQAPNVAARRSSFVPWRLRTLLRPSTGAPRQGHIRPRPAHSRIAQYSLAQDGSSGGS